MCSENYTLNKHYENGTGTVHRYIVRTGVTITHDCTSLYISINSIINQHMHADNASRIQ